MRPLLSRLQAFLPAPFNASRRERIYGALGALIGLLCTEGISYLALGGLQPWFIAPMGASAVLLFAVPASPLAQPWSLIGGNTLAALIGVCCAQLITDTGLAAALAVALAIALMFRLRCLHPPAGAVALTAVLGGPVITELGFYFLLWPVLLNSVALLLVALVFNNALGRRYPHRTQELRNPHHTRDPLPSQRVGISSADLDAVLSAREEMLDISKDDLQEILLAAEARAQQRQFGNIVCADIMSRDVAYVRPDMPLTEAWQKLKHHKVTALPVLADDDTLTGIVTLHDFFVPDHDSSYALPQAQSATLRVLDIMTPRVLTASPGTGLTELVGLFSDRGLHHLPVLGEDRRVLGMVTQSDLVAALFHAGRR